jgi:hypothetical protein
VDTIPEINGLLVPWKRFGQLKAEPLSLEVELDLASTPADMRGSPMLRACMTHVESRSDQRQPA